MEKGPFPVALWGASQREALDHIKHRPVVMTLSGVADNSFRWLLIHCTLRFPSRGGGQEHRNSVGLYQRTVRGLYQAAEMSPCEGFQQKGLWGSE